MSTIPWDGSPTVRPGLTAHYRHDREFGLPDGRKPDHGSGGEPDKRRGKTFTYSYDHNGVRTSKTVNGVVHTYHYASGKLLRETYGSNTLDFFYDASGMPFAVSHNGTVYYYITNLQGDVMQLVDANGATVASYEYDPYGTIISATGTMAEVNPLRYRGYYYDTETEFYYLQSRYYDPEVGRFINADVMISTGQGILGNNMFAYCGNNPVCNADTKGTFFFTALGAVTGFISGAFTAMVTGQEQTDWFDIATQSAVGGAIAGAGVDIGLLLIGSMGASAPVVGGAVALAYATGGAGNAYSTYATSNGNADSTDLLGSFIIGGTFNTFSFATSLSAVASTIDELIFLGLYSFDENFIVGTMIGTSTGIATTIGVSTEANNSVNSARNTRQSSKKNNSLFLVAKE